MECDEFVCSLCFNHPKHDIIQVTHAFEMDYSKEISIEKEIGDIDDEIIELEEKLNQLVRKRKKLCKRKEEIEESKKKIDQTKTFLLSLIKTLPPLPLSSFHSPSENIKNNNKNIKNNNKINNNENNNIINLVEKKENRLKELLEEKILRKIYQKILPQNFNSIKEYISKEEAKELNKMIQNNELIQNKNLITIIGNSRSQISHLNNPYYIAMNSSLNLIAVSHSNNRIQLFNMNGSFIKSFSVSNICGISMISSRNFLVITTSNKINFYSIGDILLLPCQINNENVKPTLEIGLPFSTQFSDFAYNLNLDLFAVCDTYNNTRKIHFFQLSTSVHKTTIDLQFSPRRIEIEDNLLAIISSDTHLRLYHLSISENGEIKCELTRSCSFSCQVNNLFPYPAINSAANYIIATQPSSQCIQFYSLSGDLISTFKPEGNMSVTFNSPSGVCVDKESNLIALCNSGANSILLFRSPVYVSYHPVYYSDFVAKRNFFG